MHKLEATNLNNKICQLKLYDNLTDRIEFKILCKENMLWSIYNYMFGGYICGSINMPLGSTIYRYFIVILNESDSLEVNKINILEPNKIIKSFRVQFDDVDFIGFDNLFEKYGFMSSD